jgi:hypothetical protein
MDRQIENERTDADSRAGSAKPGTEHNASRQRHSDHLMCRTPLWGVAGFLGCAYFAWLSFGHVSRSEYEWPHDYWTAATYIVWIILLAALALDTRCLRERLFFGVLVTNFVVGFALTLWHGISTSDVHTARIATGALWALAALMSLTTLRGAPESRRNH